MKMILQKIISNNGYCSRRQADALIRAGQVKINGQLATIGDQADLNRDTITINDRLLSPADPKIYIKFNKPLGYTCTNRSFKNEKNIFDLINVPARVFAVGRLDKDSRGLVLLTNDGDLTQRLAHPKFQHEKIYEVEVNGEITNIDKIKTNFLKGIDLGDTDGIGRAKKIEYLQNRIFIITLSEGKKRQIRRMFGVMNLEVIDLKRINLAGLEIGNLPEGRWAYLTTEEINKLKI
ncbi:MAG: pseudouridine synthase [Patescibacteria group bacterium]|jgi:pseudouridine synthase